MEYVSIQKLMGKCNKIHVITVRRDKSMLITNLQENRSIFNQISHIQAVGNKLISLRTNPPTLDHIGDVVKILFNQNGMTQYSKLMRRWKNPLLSVLHSKVLNFRQTQKYCILGYT